MGSINKLKCQIYCRQNEVVSKQMTPVTSDSRPAKILDMSKTPKIIKMAKNTNTRIKNETLFSSNGEKKQEAIVKHVYFVMLCFTNRLK